MTIAIGPFAIAERSRLWMETVPTVNVTGCPGPTIMSPTPNSVVPAPIQSPTWSGGIPIGTISKPTTEPESESPSPPGQPAIVPAISPRDGWAIPYRTDPWRVVITCAINYGVIVGNDGAEVTGCVSFINDIRRRTVQLHKGEIIQRGSRRDGVNHLWHGSRRCPWPIDRCGGIPDTVLTGIP